MTNTTFPPLSRRERQCLFHLAEGLRTEAIAQTLGTYKGTVEKQIASAKRKLGAATAEHAVAIAIRNDLLAPDCVDTPSEEKPKSGT